MPAFFFVLLNALLIALASEGIKATIAFAGKHLKLEDLASAVAIATLIAIIVAFTLSPLLPAFTLLLEGKPLPGWWREALVASARERGGDASREAGGYRQYAAAANRLNRDSVARFARAIKERPAAAFDRKAVAEARRSSLAAEEAAGKVRTNGDAGVFDPDLVIQATAALLSARDRLEAALMAHPKPNALSADAAEADREAAATLEATHQSFAALLPRALAEGTSLLRKAESRLAGLIVANDPQPTRFGNLRAQLHDYCRKVYRAEYDYLWPRLRLVIDGEADKAPSLQDAQDQLDFSLMMTMLILVSAVGWFVWLIAALDRPWTIVAAGIAAPVLLIFFYNVVLESQRALTASTQAAIDRFRLKLLAQLNAPAPAGYQAEVTSWRSLQAISNGYLSSGIFNLGNDFMYKK